jgi:hypothetical protein
MDNNTIQKESKLDNKLDNKLEKQDINLNEIMRKIDSDTVNKISVLNNNKSDICSHDVCNIMKHGVNEFTEKTGRNMTYSEIRRIFG